jgi:hypothetical protein
MIVVDLSQLLEFEFIPIAGYVENRPYKHSVVSKVFKNGNGRDRVKVYTVSDYYGCCVTDAVVAVWINHNVAQRHKSY